MAKRCPNCNYLNDESAVYCTECGKKIEAGQQADQRAHNPNDPLLQYPDSTPVSQKKSISPVIIVLGSVLLFFLLLGTFMGFILPNLIVDNNYQPPTETYPEGFHPPTDYFTLDASTLDYADESTMKDFSFADGWKTMSSSAKRITDFESILGFWKAVMITDPENESEEGTSYDYFSIEIYGMPEDARVTVHWNCRLIEKTGEEQELRGSRAGLEGTFQNGAVFAENANGIEITDFWLDGNKEYAVGRFMWTNGTIGYIGLVRGE